ncbi:MULTISPECIES: LCP family protein [unclassified Nocardioides]|uniref:LCP family protein n=1 Tax=unclassified Nocardioides TaxID=2615069 RepID=UPI0009F01DE2|nr:MULTISPECIES: LCP family protein [unclassified Nocardioides]GAW48667.1 Cell envelope-related transcriptional attenuator [Nocardioides sp. PD653-B2]GAW54234.1 Cell envelope-related transcriptional attenuator [Nocardioides sp. PD653]
MPEKRHRRGVLRVIIVAELVVALVTAATVVFAYNHLDSNIAEGPGIHHRNAKQPQAADQPHEPLNILLMGTDTRDCAGCKVDGEAGGGVSDTTILLHVAADRKSAYGISIPRDLLVDRPDCVVDGKTIPGASDVLWNAAFGVGGPACTVEQVESVFAPIYVDDYLTIDFGGFKDMVDAIGGVNVCIPEPLDDPTYLHVHFDRGESVHLDGTDALAYVRLRHVLAGTDIGRMKRQQSFIAAMAHKVISADTLARPDKLYRFAGALTSSLQASPDLASAGALVRLAGELKDVDLTHIKFVTMPNFLYLEGTAGYPHVGLLPAHKKLVELVNDDRPLGSFVRDSVSADGPDKNPTQKQKDAAAAAGICA